ncbi:hypothetical protein cypCar_00026552 [Cyprinus carpio]|nr:hypothetical protein cypCar_00026552 [Cyprinus carpio]
MSIDTGGFIACIVTVGRYSLLLFFSAVLLLLLIRCPTQMHLLDVMTADVLGEPAALVTSILASRTPRFQIICEMKFVSSISAVLLLLLIRCLQQMHLLDVMTADVLGNLLALVHPYWLQETPDFRLLLATSAVMLMTQRVSSLALAGNSH